MPAVPGNEMCEPGAGVEAHDGAAKLAGPHFGGAEQGPAEPATRAGRIGGDAPDQQVLRARFKDERAGEPPGILSQSDFHVAQDRGVVCLQRDGLDTQQLAVPRIRRTLQCDQNRQVAALRAPQNEGIPAQQLRCAHSVKPPSERKAEPVV